MTEEEYKKVALDYIAANGLNGGQIQLIFSVENETTEREEILLAQIQYLNNRIMDFYQILEEIASKVSPNEAIELANIYLQNIAEKRSPKTKV